VRNWTQVQFSFFLSLPINDTDGNAIYDIKLVLCRKSQLFSGKSTKLLPPELHFLTPICTTSFVGCGFVPDPTGGAYSAPPDPLAVFRGPTSKERGEEGRAEEG